MAQIPTPDFAVPYAAPKHVKTIAEVQPMAPKNGYMKISMMFSMTLGWVSIRWSSKMLLCLDLDGVGIRTAYTGLEK
jgi:hypothetical protein